MSLRILVRTTSPCWPLLKIIERAHAGAGVTQTQKPHAHWSGLAQKDPKAREKYLDRVTAAVAGVKASGDSDCSFKLLSNMQQASVLAAKETFRTSGCLIWPLVSRHSEAFRKIAARIRLLRVMCRELLACRTELAAGQSCHSPCIRCQGNDKAVARVSGSIFRGVCLPGAR